MDAPGARPRAVGVGVLLPDDWKPRAWHGDQPFGRGQGCVAEMRTEKSEEPGRTPTVMGERHGKYRPRRIPERLSLASYFHQDYDLEAETPLGVVENFLEESDARSVVELRRELTRLLAGAAGEAQLVQEWLGDGCASYDPRRDGLSMRDWYRAIIGLMDRRQ